MVFLIAAVSVDGKIAEIEGQSTKDWTSKEDTAFFVEKTKAAGVVVMGRKTFDTIGKALPERLNVVMTYEPTSHQMIPGALEFTSESPEMIVDRLKSDFKDIAVIGGAETFEAFLKAGVVTDLFLTIEPYIFSEGMPLVRNIDRIDLDLVESKMIGDQATMMHYRVL